MSKTEPFLAALQDTLLLRSQTKIVGEGLAHIWLGNSTKGFDDPEHPKPARHCLSLIFCCPLTAFP